MGTERSVLTDERGLPLSVVLSGTNTHGVRLLEATLDQIVVQRPESSAKFTQSLCLDAGYTSSKDRAEKRGCIAYTRPRSEGKQELLRDPGFRARCWVVEVTHSFFDRFRKLLIRFEKKAASYLGLLHFARAIIVWRKLARVHI